MIMMIKISIAFGICNINKNIEMKQFSFFWTVCEAVLRDFSVNNTISTFFAWLTLILVTKRHCFYFCSFLVPRRHFFFFFIVQNKYFIFPIEKDVNHPLKEFDTFDNVTVSASSNNAVQQHQQHSGRVNEQHYTL